MTTLDDLLAQRATGAVVGAQTGQPSLDSMLAQRSSGQSIAQGQTQPVAGNQISMMGRVGHGMMDPLDGGAQLLTHSLPGKVVNAVNDATAYVNNLPVIGPVTKLLGMTPATSGQIDASIAAKEKQYQADRRASGSTGIDWARGIGAGATTTPLMLATGLAGAGAAVGGASGAINGALTPVTQVDAQHPYWDQKTGQVVSGAATGAVLGKGMDLAGSAIKGVTGAAQRRMADAGVTMTPGQILGGALAKTEDKLTSVPVLGDLIKNAQRRSVEDFNRATYNQVLEPLGQTYQGPIGNEGVQSVKDAIGNAYDNALSRMHFSANDQGFLSDLGNLSQMAQNLPATQRQQFQNIIDTQVMGKLGPQGLMDGPTLKGTQSELARIARGYASDSSFDNRNLGAAISEVKDAIDRSLARTNPADAANQLNAANSAWARFVRLRGAASSQGAMNNSGVFTPAQLTGAVKVADKSVGKGAVATGNALMQDYATDAQSVLGAKYPDSGTAGRSMMGLAGGALLGHEFLPPAVTIPAAVGAGVISAPYTPIGQRIAQHLLMSRPDSAQAVGQTVQRYGGPFAASLAQALVQKSQ